MHSTLVKKNVFFAIIAQVVSMICGFLTPRIILEYFGSETNGLVASISQFLNYVTLLEGGVSGVAVAALYKPLHDNDQERINALIGAIQKFFLRLGIICLGFTVIVAFSYPAFIKTSFSYEYVFLLTLVLGIRLIVLYCSSITFRLLLRADQKVYYVSIVHIIITTGHFVLVAFSASCMSSVLTVYLISGMIYLTQPVFYLLYVRKHYSIKKPPKANIQILAQKKYGFGHNLAYFIHTNTDIVLLTFFSTLSNVSVYSVYMMIASALLGIITTISSAVSPTIGALIAKGDKDEINTAFTRYEFFLVLISFISFTCAIELAVPFVSVYTKGINDAEYYQPVFCILILLAELVGCVREPYISVAYAAGHFKQTSQYAYIEAGSNIILSLLLIQIWALPGVAIGTLISMTIRMFFQVKYLSKNILYRNIKLFYTKLLAYCFTGALSIVFTMLFIPHIMIDFIEWSIYAVFSFALTMFMFVCINILFYKKNLSNIFDNYKHKDQCSF